MKSTNPFFSNRQKIRTNTSQKKIFGKKINIWKNAQPHYLLRECRLKPQWDTTIHLLERLYLITLPKKVHLLKAMVFLVVMYGCESWTIKKAEGRRIDPFELWCWRRLLRVPWTARRSNQSWIFIGRIDAEAETPILWPPDVKNLLIGKDPDAGKDWRQKKGMAEDEMIGWHHQLDGHEFEQAPGVGDGQVPGSSPGGVRGFKGETASAIRKQQLI